MTRAWWTTWRNWPRYGAQALKRFAPAKRYALVACFLAETRKTLLDHVVEMHDQYLIDMCRRARSAFEEQHRQFRRKAKEGLEMALAAVDILLDSASARENRLDRLYQQIDDENLREAVMSCRYFKRLEERGYLDELCARYAPPCVAICRPSLECPSRRRSEASRYLLRSISYAALIR